MIQIITIRTGLTVVALHVNDNDEVYVAVGFTMRHASWKLNRLMDKTEASRTKHGS